MIKGKGAGCGCLPCFSHRLSEVLSLQTLLTFLTKANLASYFLVPCTHTRKRAGWELRGKLALEIAPLLGLAGKLAAGATSMPSLNSRHCEPSTPRHAKLLLNSV